VVAVQPVWIGGTPIVEMRLTHDAANPGTDGAILLASEVQRIQYTIYRAVSGVETPVTDYATLDLNKSGHWFDAFQNWSQDATGYNFRHVIPAAAVASAALYRAVYWFTLTSGEVRAVPVRWPMLGPMGGSLLGTGGGGAAPDPDPDPDPDPEVGEEPLMYSALTGKTITNTTSELTLLDTGAGTLVIDAGAWPLGAVLELVAGGAYSSLAGLAGNCTWRLKVGAEASLPLELTLTPGQVLQPWEIRSRLTRTATGALGTLRGSMAGDLQSSATKTEGSEAWPAAVAAPSDAAKTLDFTGQFSVQNAANVLRLDYCHLRLLKVQAPTP